MQTDSAVQPWPAADEPVARQYVSRLSGAVFPLTAGFAFYGWRGMGVIIVLLVATLAAAAAWRRVGQRGAALHLPQSLWMAIVLGMMLPAHVFTQQPSVLLTPWSMTWTLLPGAALLLVALNWVIGPGRLAHLHPAVVTYLALVVLFGSPLNPHAVLRPGRVFTGDIVNFYRPDDTPAPPPPDEEWISIREPGNTEAFYLPQSAARQLTNYTTGKHRDWFSLEALLREAVPPLKDLLVGGHPGPIGGSSAIAVLIGGLFLLHRGLIDYRTPLLIVLAAYLALLLLPVPVAITEGRAQWMPMVARRAHLDWATIITFVNYEMAASPLLFMAFFLANSPCVCPVSHKAQAVYATMIGFLSAICMLYVSCAVGPYMALATVSLVAPGLDCRCAPLEKS